MTTKPRILVTSAALRTGGLPKALNYLGVVIGVAGILTIVTRLDVVLAALDVPDAVLVIDGDSMGWDHHVAP